MSKKHADKKKERNSRLKHCKCVEKFSAREEKDGTIENMLPQHVAAPQNIEGI